MESLKCKVESGSEMVQRSKAYDETARYHCGLSSEDLVMAFKALHGAIAVDSLRNI